MTKQEQKVMITKDGPYLLSGNLPIDKQIITMGKNGEPEKWAKGRCLPSNQPCALCRCGESKNKPFCDGAHARVGFNGAETASKKPFDQQAKVRDGATLILKDVSTLCSAARFCHMSGGTRGLTHRSNDPKARELAIEEACNCPSGRLVEYQKKTGKAIEKEFGKSISLVEDPQNKVSGPIWVKGGVPIESSDGSIYEIRNRVTLCRCGHSKNKPFCDGSHIEEGFDDGDESLR